jgi:hypothetical protein
VEQVATALKVRRVRCFYDADRQVELWGRHLAEELPRIYAKESSAVIVFVSADYADGGWTRLERRAAFSQAVAEAGVYVLPARFDDSELPGLLDDMVSVDLRRYTPEQFADLVAAKLDSLVAGPPCEKRSWASPGWPLVEVKDPFALEVHRPVRPEDAPALPELPVYVPREHDSELEQIVQAAAGGRSGLAVLVGGSSTGKTRACWEALGVLRNQDSSWRLWHPIDPSRPDAALRELPDIGPRTVVWLNEAQFYLDVQETGLGERVAAGLRELLRDPARAPVLVLATLWPQYWGALTARPDGSPDRCPQARELLAGNDIAVPTVFTAEQVAKLIEAKDVRLVLAAKSAADGQVVQFLAGAPELLSRYRNAPPGARAVIQAAMDARRLGMGVTLPHAFLADAAPGYLTDTEWDWLSEDWLQQALAYASMPCKGIRGTLARIRQRPGSSHMSPRSKDSADQPAESASKPAYRLADYLDQHGRIRRTTFIPPTQFWAAAAAHALPGHQAALGAAAADRGLYRAAAQLHKNAVGCGDPRSAIWLADPPSCLHADPRPALWAATQFPLDDPGAIGVLLARLRATGADQQIAALLARDPGRHAALDNPYGVAALLDGLRKAGAYDQAIALADRAAAYASVENPRGVAALVNRMRKTDACDQAAALSARAAALNGPHVTAPLPGKVQAAGAEQATRAVRILLDNPFAVASLLDRLWKVGAHDQIAAVLARNPASLVNLNESYWVAAMLDSLRKIGAHDQIAALLVRNPARNSSIEDARGVAALLKGMRKADANEQAIELATRAATYIPLKDPRGLGALLNEMREAGANEQAAELAIRVATHVAIDDPYEVVSLLDSLRRTGASDQATALATRTAAYGPLDDTGGVAVLLDSLWHADASDQAATLAGRAAIHAALHNRSGTTVLLDSLHKTGMHDQAAELLARLPAAGMFSLFLEHEGCQANYRFGREPDGASAAPWNWDELDLPRARQPSA